MRNVILREGTAEYEGKIVDLPPKMFGVMKVLVKADGQFVHRERLYWHLYAARQDAAYIQALHGAICRLRRAIAPLGLQITSRWGYGYKLEAKPEYNSKAELNQEECIA